MINHRYRQALEGMALALADEYVTEEGLAAPDLEAEEEQSWEIE